MDDGIHDNTCGFGEIYKEIDSYGIIRYIGKR